jgi:hypothetical protein
MTITGNVEASNQSYFTGPIPSTEFNATDLLKEASGNWAPVKGAENTTSEILGSWLKKNQANISKDGNFSQKELGQLVHHLEGKLKSSNSGLSKETKAEMQELLGNLKSISSEWATSLKGASHQFVKDLLDMTNGHDVVKALESFDTSKTLSQETAKSKTTFDSLTHMISRIADMDKKLASNHVLTPQELRFVIVDLEKIETSQLGNNLDCKNIKFLRTGLQEALKKYDTVVERVNANTALTAEVKATNIKVAEQTLRSDVAVTNLLTQTDVSNTALTSNTSDMMQNVFNHSKLVEKLSDESWRPSDFASPKSYSVDGMQDALDALSSQHELVASLGNEVAANHIENKMRLIEVELNKLSSGDVSVADRDVALLKFSKLSSLLDFTTLAGMEEMLKLKKSQMPEAPTDPTAKAEHEKKIQEIDSQLADIKIDKETADKIMVSIQEAIEKASEGKSEAYKRAFG